MQTLGVGTKLFAVVKDVSSRGVVLSLPNGMIGHAAPTEISDVLTEHMMFSRPLPRHTPAAGGSVREKLIPVEGEPLESAMQQCVRPGQLVRAVVLSVGTRKGSRQIDVSLRPSLTNASVDARALVQGSLVFGCVRSREDHGWVVETGIQKATAFLPFKSEDKTPKKKKKRSADEMTAQEQSTSGLAGEEDIQVGRLVWMVVDSADPKAGTIRVHTSSNAVATAKATAVGLTASGLQPGMRMKCLVESVVANGLVVSFLGFFRGTIHITHLPKPASAFWKQHYKVGNK